MSIKFDAILGKIREDDAFSGSYNDLQDLPTLGTAAALNYGTSENNLPILDAQGKININVLPGVALTDTFVVASEAAMLALTAQTGDVAVRSDENKTYILKGTSASTLADWQELLTPTDSVHSVFGRQGTVTAQTNDYTWAQINKTTSSLADITTRNYSDLSGLPTLGTLSTQNGTFSGGGTLATGGFTLTVPATGTAALLGTANVFTANQTVTVDQGNAEVQAFSYRDTPSAGFFRANKARGTLAAPTVIQNGDLIGGFIGNGYTGADFVASAQVSIYADGSMSSRIPGRIDFMTSDGVSSPAVRLTVKSDGNVGIGTTNPGERLDVFGGGRFSAGAFTTHGSALIYSNSSLGPHIVGNTDTSGNSTITASAMRAQFGGLGFRVAYSPSTTAGAARTFTDAFIVTTTGSVGIGTTAPASKFDAVVDGNGGIFRRYGGSPSMQFARANGTLASPTQVNSATTIGAFGATALDNTSVYRTVAVIRFNSEGAVTSTSAAGSVTIQTTPSGSVTAVDRLVVNSSGNVGIGTTSPTGELHIDQASTTGAIPTLILDQADVSEEFIEFVSTSAANNTNPISTTAVGTYAGKLRINVNGTYYWLPYYNP